MDLLLAYGVSRWCTAQKTTWAVQHCDLASAKGRTWEGLGFLLMIFNGGNQSCVASCEFPPYFVDHQHVYWCSTWNVNKDTSWKQTKCINSATLIFPKKEVSSTKRMIHLLRCFIPIPLGVFVESGGDLKLYMCGGDLDYLSWWLWDRLWSRLCASSNAMQGGRGAGKIPSG